MVQYRLNQEYPAYLVIQELLENQGNLADQFIQDIQRHQEQLADQEYQKQENLENQERLDPLVYRPTPDCHHNQNI